MRAHPLSPYVTVQYFCNSRAGLIKVRQPCEVDADGRADFAIVTIGEGDLAPAPSVYLDTPRPDNRLAVRFDLPFERQKLDAFLAAVTIAYGLGHRDRANRMRQVMGLAPSLVIPNLERVADDRN